MGNTLITGIFPNLTVLLNHHMITEEHLRHCSQKNPRKRKRSSNRRHNRQFILYEIDELSDLDFRKMLRMKRKSFNKLYSAVEPLLYTTNNYLDICIAYGVSRSSFFSTSFESVIVWPVIDAINVAFQIGIPRCRDKLREKSNGFIRFTGGELWGGVSAIDGWVCVTRKPNQSEVGYVVAYQNCHGCWGLVVLAGCDADCCFNIFSCINSGSTNDCLAWDLSCASSVEEDPNWPSDFYVIGDEAFVCTHNFLTPYNGHGLGPWKDAFTFYLSSMRQCVERSFALLVLHWGIWWRPLQFDFSCWTKVLTALAKLHNFALMNRAFQ
jgi:hypothetical protein